MIPPFTAERYAQIDYWPTCSGWKSSCANVQSRREIAFDSDHLLLESYVYTYDVPYSLTLKSQGFNKKRKINVKPHSEMMTRRF